MNSRLRSAARVVPWIILLCLLVAAGSIRWHRLARESLAIDEYWAVYLATGRGNAIFQIPYDQIVISPPAVGFEGAPAWWHIWTGIGGVTHPPFYYLSLRWWIDCFSSGDLATRSLSAIFSVGAIFLLFDVVRRIAGPWKGLIAAGLMTFAPAQIDFAQIDRPYTMLIFFGLALCDAIIATQRGGTSPAKITSIGITTFLLAMTHYFALGGIAAAGVYSIVRLRGRARRLTLAAISAALILALIIWGPVLWQTRYVFSSYPEFGVEPNSGFVEHLRAILAAPILLCLDPAAAWGWLTFVPLALLVYLIPLVRLKKSPELLLWWLWMAGTIGLIVVADLLHHSILELKLRYLFLISPALYAILVTTLPSRIGGVVAALILCCTAVYGVSRVQVGPDPNEDWRTMSRLIRQHAGPDNLVCLIGYYPTEPSFDYFVVAHYGGEWKNPVLLIVSAPDEALRARMATQKRILMVGHAAASETRRLMPGWSVGAISGIGPRNAIWELIPPASAK